MNLEPFTGPGSTPSRRRFWDKITKAVIASQKVAGKNVSVDEHYGSGTVINVIRERGESEPGCDICECTGLFNQTWPALFNSSDGKWYSTRIDNACTSGLTFSGEVPEGTRFRQNATTIEACGGGMSGSVSCTFQLNTLTCIREQIFCAGEIDNFFGCVWGCEEDDPEGLCSFYCVEGPFISGGLIVTTVLSDCCTFPE